MFLGLASNRRTAVVGVVQRALSSCENERALAGVTTIGSLRVRQRAAATMSLIRSAQLNGHDPYVYLKGVRNRLPTHRAFAGRSPSRFVQLLVRDATRM